MQIVCVHAYIKNSKEENARNVLVIFYKTVINER